MAVDALEGPEGVFWGMGGEGKNRPGGGGKLAPHSALLPRACVCAPGLLCFFFLSPLSESNTGPMEGGLTESWPPKTWRYRRYPHLWDYAGGQQWEGEVGWSLLWLLVVQKEISLLWEGSVPRAGAAAQRTG